MDFFDIFKKLRTGAKFNCNARKKDGVKSQVATTAKAGVAGPSTESLVKSSSSKGTAHEGASDDDETRPTASKKARKTYSDGSDSDDNFLLLSSKTVPKKRLKAKKVVSQKLKQKQEANRCRHEHKIHVWGEDIPDPLTSFEQLTTSKYGVHGDILKNIGELSFPTPTPIQMQAIPVMMQRREILGCAPTGSGKTAAFLIPIIHQLKGPQKLGFRAVIVEPTRELATQVYRECCRLSENRRLRVHVIDKVSLAEKKFGPKSAQRFDILITTPNRLVALLDGDRPIINLSNAEWLIIDESDKLFESGKQGFRDQLAVIYKACSSPKVRHAMFSATFARDVEDWCKLNLDNCITVSIGARNSAAETVEQKLVFVGNESGKLIAFRDLIKTGFTPPVLVFVQTKERAQELFSELIYDGINVDVIHADRTQMQRDNVVKAFRLGKIWVLICTDLMGRGIDFKGVNLVVNYDFPPSAISYIHRIGRTGRAGRRGSAVTFFTEADFVNLKSIAQVMRAAKCPIPEYMLKLPEPNKKQKELLVRQGLRRQPISTIPQFDYDKVERKRREKNRKRVLNKKPEQNQSLNE